MFDVIMYCVNIFIYTMRSSVLTRHNWKIQVQIVSYLSEENGMDQENPTGEEELAVLALYKTLHQYTGR